MNRTASTSVFVVLLVVVVILPGAATVVRADTLRDARDGWTSPDDRGDLR